MDPKVEMYHPDKWGEGYYMNYASIAFKLEGNEFVEVAYSNSRNGWIPMRFSIEDVVIVRNFK